MVDIHKQTNAFIDEYSCSYLQARNAALLTKDLYEATSPQNISVHLVLEKWGLLKKPSTCVQVLKACAICVLLFTDYTSQKENINTPDELTFPDLNEHVYPIVAFVMEIPKPYVQSYVRGLLRNFSNFCNAQELIFALVDESISIM